MISFARVQNFLRIRYKGSALRISSGMRCRPETTAPFTTSEIEEIPVKIDNSIVKGKFHACNILLRSAIEYSRYLYEYIFDRLAIEFALYTYPFCAIIIIVIIVIISVIVIASTCLRARIPPPETLTAPAMKLDVSHVHPKGLEGVRCECARGKSAVSAGAYCHPDPEDYGIYKSGYRRDAGHISISFSVSLGPHRIARTTARTAVLLRLLCVLVFERACP